MAKLCCVEDQGRASHCVVEPGEEIDHGDDEYGDCDVKDAVDNGEDRNGKQNLSLPSSTGAQAGPKPSPGIVSSPPATISVGVLKSQGGQEQSKKT